MASKPYHHGNLREALLTAGRDLLEEKGTDGFSLRACAARAGVSHAAPAHHFGDVRALLTALAVQGFAELAEVLKAARATGGSDAKRAMQAVGLAYIVFARKNPALFALMFDGERLNRDDAALMEASAQADDELALVAVPASRRTGPAGPHTPGLMTLFLHSMAHGYAHLALAGQAGSDGDGREEDDASALLRTVSELMLEG